MCYVFSEAAGELFSYEIFEKFSSIILSKKKIMSTIYFGLEIF